MPRLSARKLHCREARSCKALYAECRAEVSSILTFLVEEVVLLAEDYEIDELIATEEFDDFQDEPVFLEQIIKEDETSAPSKFLKWNSAADTCFRLLGESERTNQRKRKSKNELAKIASKCQKLTNTYQVVSKVGICTPKPVEEDINKTTFDEYQRFTSYQEAIDSLVPFTELTTNQEWDKSVKKEMSIFQINQFKALRSFFEMLNNGEGKYSASATDAELVFAFDNSQNHHAMAPDALVATRLNKSDGGKNVPLLRDGWFKDATGEIRIQKMQFEDGKPKGIETILREREVWPGVKFNLQCKGSCEGINCCARKLLSSQEDFQSQQTWLEEEVSKRNHHIIFYPKFHCELNFIEMVWGYIKSKLRYMCTFNFHDLCENTPKLLDSIAADMIQRFARHCFRFMEGYRAGLHGPVLDYALKKYKSHRTIPECSYELLKEEMDKLKKSKMDCSK